MMLGYCRVSTEDQAQDNRTSLSEQQRMIRGAAMTRGIASYDLVFFIDPGVSGSVPLTDRPSGGRLLDAVNPGDIVISAKLDRMFRNTLDALTVAQDFRQRGIDLAFLDFMGGEPVTGTGMAQCFFTIANAFAQLERDRISERVNDGKAAKRAKGGHVGGVAPFGWQIVGSGRDSKLVPNPVEQATVHVIKDVAARFTPADACRELAKLGVYDRAGSHFRPNQVQRIAARELYNA